MLRTLGAQILAELVAEIGRRVALREHRRRRLAVDGTVIARQEHRHLPARGLLEQREERGAAKPLARELPERDLVARDLVEDRGLASAMRQQVHEVEDERTDSFGRDRPADPALEVVGVVRRRDLLIAYRRRAADLGEVRVEQVALVRVERLVLLIAPPVRQARRDLAREEPGEEGVPGVGRRGREDGEVVRRLDVEERGDRRLEDAPLVEAETVHDDEDSRLLLREDGEEELAHHIDRERRTVTLEIAEPGRVGSSHEVGELAPHVRIERLE